MVHCQRNVHKYTVKVISARYSSFLRLPCYLYFGLMIAKLTEAP